MGFSALERAGAYMSQERPIVSSFVFGSAEAVPVGGLEPAGPVAPNRKPPMTQRRSNGAPDDLGQRGPAGGPFGQAGASQSRSSIFSGFGGQTDFIVGAMHAPGGRAFIALPSWAPSPTPRRSCPPSVSR